MIWYKDNKNDIVLSTRIRLARNVAGVPFPNALADKKGTLKQIRDAVMDDKSALSNEFEYTDLSKLDALKKQTLAEEHLISFDMLKGDGKAVMINKDQTISIMAMEEDHIRLQVILPGNELDKAWDLASKVDDVIGESIDYAFDEKLGYLTACPTNVGTGLRASVMMHLPALVAGGSISRIINSAQSMGIAVRGLYGEGSKAYGSLFQISNQVTTGASEKEIIDKVKDIVNQISELEKKARKTLLDNDKVAFADKVYRAYGTLKYVQSISSAEAKELLSLVMLGKDMGIIKEEGALSPIECMVRTEPALVCEGKSRKPDERDELRAKILRGAL